MFLKPAGHQPQPLPAKPQTADPRGRADAVFQDVQARRLDLLNHLTPYSLNFDMSQTPSLFSQSNRWRGSHQMLQLGHEFGNIFKLKID